MDDDDYRMQANLLQQGCVSYCQVNAGTIAVVEHLSAGSNSLAGMFE